MLGGVLGGGGEFEGDRAAFGEAGGDDSAPVGPATVWFGCVPACGEERMVERDFLCSGAERKNFDAEGALVARVWREITGDSAPRVNGDRSVLIGVEREGGVVGEMLVGAGEDLGAGLFHDGAGFGEGRAAGCCGGSVISVCAVWV